MQTRYAAATDVLPIDPASFFYYLTHHISAESIQNSQKALHRKAVQMVIR